MHHKNAAQADAGLSIAVDRRPLRGHGRRAGCSPEPKHAPETEDLRRKMLALEQPFIEQFEYADTWGHALVSVRGDQVRASVFQGLERKPWKSLDLTSALGEPD